MQTNRPKRGIINTRIGGEEGRIVVPLVFIAESNFDKLWAWLWLANTPEAERRRTFILSLLTFLAFTALVLYAYRRLIGHPIKQVLLGQLRQLAPGMKDVPGELYSLLFLVYGERKKVERARAERDLNNVVPMAAWYASRLPPTYTWLKDRLLDQQLQTAPSKLRPWLLQAIDIVEDLGLDQDRQALKTMRKVCWVTFVLAGFLVLLLTSIGHGGLALMGVAGGLISRLLRFFRNREAADSYDFNWTIIFLTPLVGALAGVAGVMAIDSLTAWQVLGDFARRVSWTRDSMNTETAFVAFLFGFSERLLDRVLQVTNTKFGTGFDEKSDVIPPGADPGATKLDGGSSMNLNKGVRGAGATARKAGVWHRRKGN